MIEAHPSVRMTVTQFLGTWKTDATILTEVIADLENPETVIFVFEARW